MFDNVTKAIEFLLNDKYRSYLPHEINSGLCKNFAEDLEELMGAGNADWIPYCIHGKDLTIEGSLHEDCEPIPHAAFYIHDLWYDSECPSGVKDPRDLPCCKYIVLANNKLSETKQRRYRLSING